MVYAATKEVIIYWKPDQPFFIHIADHFWVDEYNFPLSIEHTHSPGSLPIQQYPKSLINNSDLLTCISC